MREIDLIIPFHRPIDRYLLGAIESAQNSVGVLVNLLLINDRAENADSSRALRKMGHRVIDSENIGYANCINLGIEKSNSEFIGILNSDDLQNHDRLRKQIGKMIFDGTMMSICKLRKFKNGRKIHELSGSQMKGDYNRVQLLLGAYGANASLILKRNSTVYGSFRDVDMSDWEYGFRNYSEKISYLEEEMYLYRMHPGQITRNKVNTPEWLFYEWSNLFRTISEFEVPNPVIEACSRPNLITKLEFEDLILLAEVLSQIQSTLLSMGGNSADEINGLITRRFILASKNRFLFSKDAFRLINSSPSKLLHVISKLAFELASNGYGSRR